jgi:hypothetical protein
MEAKARMRARGLSPPPCRLRGADEHGGRAVDDARRIARMVMHVVDASTSGWAAIATASKPPISPI